MNNDNYDAFARDLQAWDRDGRRGAKPDVMDYVRRSRASDTSGGNPRRVSVRETAPTVDNAGASYFAPRELPDDDKPPRRFGGADIVKLDGRLASLERGPVVLGRRETVVLGRRETVVLIGRAGGAL